MNKQSFLFVIKLIGYRLASIFLCVFFLMAFTWLLKLNNGFLYYSILTTLVLFSFMYSEFYDKARRDMRAKASVYPLKGAVFALAAEIPSAILLVWALVSKSFAANVSYIIWNAPFSGFLVPNGNIASANSANIFYYLVLLLIPIMALAGYYAGMRKFEVPQKYINKIFYKKKKND